MVLDWFWGVTLSVGVMSLMASFPLILGLHLLAIAVLISLLVVGTLNVVWYSYVFFIILVGGVLVLFLYMACVSPDDGGMSWKFSLTGGLVAFIVGFNVESEQGLSTSDLLMGQSFSNIYVAPVLWMVLFAACYLLVAFLVVVRVVRKEEGPLRTT